MRNRQLALDMTGLSFTRKWFINRNLSTFREFIYPKWAGRDRMVYLELGVFEGMSLSWMFQHILTDESSRAVGIDPWLETTKLSESYMEMVKERAFRNLDAYTHRGVMYMGAGNKRLHLKRGNSAEILRKMCGRGYLGISKGMVDLCMVDGNHNALAVLDDLRHVYLLVRPGGWIIMDDVENDREKHDHVKQGIEMWLNELKIQGKENAVSLSWKSGYCECYVKNEQ